MTGEDNLWLEERIRDLNTKDYYLLVVLSFLYTDLKNTPGHLAVIAIVLLVIAIMPMQDYPWAQRHLNTLRWFKVAILNITAVLIAACVILKRN
jgi:hypothetical protein